MKALFGFAQMGLVIWGIVGLFQGSWLTTLVAWGGAFLIGLIGSRIVRRMTGFSEGAIESMHGLESAVHALKAGDHRTALGVARGAVTQFRVGGDKMLLPFALAIKAAAHGHGGEMESARRDIAEAEQLVQTRHSNPQFEALIDSDVRPLVEAVARELRQPYVDRDRLASML